MSSEPRPVPTAGEALDRLGPLVRDMQHALRSEFGAQSAYSLLPTWTRDPELRRVLLRFRDQQKEHVESLRAVIEELGQRAPKSRWTRSVAAWGLFLVTPVLGMRFALRLCAEAADTVSRWYAEYTAHLLEHGRLEPARTCQEIGRQRARQAQVLRAFIEHLH